jgi:hypothetical protein
VWPDYRADERIAPPVPPRHKTIPDPHDHPHKCETPAPSTVATAICTTAPGTAIRRTAIKSATEKWIPTRT